MRIIQKAPQGDYPEYAEMYMKLLPNDGKIIEHLKANFEQAKAFIYNLPEERLLHRYQSDKWSIKEVLMHVIDDERIFATRAMRFSRNEKNNLIGFDQDAYVSYSNANARSLDSIFEEYEDVRRATISLFKYIPEESLDRMGHGTGTFNDATVRALIYHIAGHEQHHINFIKTNYLD